MLCVCVPLSKICVLVILVVLCHSLIARIIIHKLARGSALVPLPRGTDPDEFMNQETKGVVLCVCVPLSKICVSTVGEVVNGLGAVSWA